MSGLAAEAQSPAFLTQYGEFIYAVNELDPGRVSAFALTDNGLAFLNSVPTDGAYPCHLAATADWLSVANYSTGSVATFRIDDGAIGQRVDFAQHSGSGPNPIRQKSAHAHQTYLATDCDMLVPDLGNDRLYRYRIDVTGAFVGEPGVTQLAAGAGPRHVERHPTLPILYRHQRTRQHDRRAGTRCRQSDANPANRFDVAGRLRRGPAPRRKSWFLRTAASSTAATAATRAS